MLDAVIHVPSRLADLRTWLTAQNFAEPRHRAVYATVQALHTAGRFGPEPAQAGLSRAAGGQPPNATSTTAASIVAVLRRALQHERPTDAPFGMVGELDELLVDFHQAGEGVSTAQYVRYARMVLETAVRHQLDTWGVLTERATDTAATEHSGLSALQVTREAMAENVADLAIQIRRSQGEVAHRLDRVPAAPPPTIPVTVPLPPCLVQRAELRLIHAVLGPSTPATTNLLVRFTPEDFVSSPAHRTVWSVTQSLAAAGDPVDPITVAWELEAIDTDARRQQVPPALHTLTAAELHPASNPPAGDLDQAVSVVERSALAHHGRLARARITQASADRQRTLPDTLRDAEVAVEDLGHTDQRLIGEMAPAAPSRVLQTLDGDRPPTPLGSPQNQEGKPRTR